MKKEKKEESYVGKTEDFVKKNPLTTLIGAALLGYAVGRLIHKRDKK
ncbi:MAG: DUF883 C-terminal domain-containing protein [Candidatus Nanoarchaeia archaeon]|jgi:ElaB/YqjD/DUF883 family membrane-anchored ribosome-binding protein|nr:DUF883 C-terminal domain-containing protein [Candidatus Nanoarchaeia archaeon]